MIPPLYDPVDGHHLRRCRRPDRILAHFLHRSPHPGWTRPRVHRHARHQLRDRNSTWLHSVSRRLFPPAPLGSAPAVSLRPHQPTDLVGPRSRLLARSHRRIGDPQLDRGPSVRTGHRGGCARGRRRRDAGHRAYGQSMPDHRGGRGRPSSSLVGRCGSMLFIVPRGVALRGNHHGWSAGRDGPENRYRVFLPAGAPDDDRRDRV